MYGSNECLKKSGFESRTFYADLVPRMWFAVSGSRRERRSIIVNFAERNCRSTLVDVTEVEKRRRANKAELGNRFR